MADATPTVTKDILSGPEPPTLEQLRTMETVQPGTQIPGTYFGLVKDAVDENSNFAYAGSGTRAGRGIGSRTSQHQDPEYRKKELE